MVYKFFDKKSAGSGVANNQIKQNQQLEEELHKPVIRNFKKEQFIQNVMMMLLMMMMMMMMMMMSCFCGMVDRQKAFILISSRDHCQRFSPLQISDTPRAGFEPAQNLNLLPALAIVGQGRLQSWQKYVRQILREKFNFNF